MEASVSFVEIHSDDDDESDNETSSSSLCDAYVAVVDPKQCSGLVKRLSRELPLPSARSTTTAAAKEHSTLDFSHLKRVKRSININISGSQGNPNTLTQSATTATGDKAAAAAAASDHDVSNKRQKTNADVDTSSAHDDVALSLATPPLTDLDATVPSSEKNNNNQICVLLGPVSILDSLYGRVPQVDEVNKAKAENKNEAKAKATPASTATTTTIAKLKSLYNLTEIIILQVPRRLAESEHEHKLFNIIWPCLYFPKKTRQYKMDQRKLSDLEVEQMHMGIRQAMQDALACQEQILQMQQQQQRMSPVSVAVGTVVVSPALCQVVSRASEERALQQAKTSSRQSLFQNPLQTSVILALQGVSRLERESANMNGIQSNDFCQGQYLCTGYDVYTTLEPSVMDAMAMVHARVRRVIFGCSTSCSVVSDNFDATNCGLTVVKVHALPGTNHKYRAFACQTGSKLWNECRLFLQQPSKREGPTRQSGNGGSVLQLQEDWSTTIDGVVPVSGTEATSVNCRENISLWSRISSEIRQKNISSHEKK